MSKAILLIIDPSDGFLAAVREGFRQAEILVAPTEPVGAQLAETEDPHVIVVGDAAGVGNLAILRKLKGHSRLRHIPVIVAVPADISLEDRVHAFDAGAAALIPATADPVEISASIRAMARIRADRTACRADGLGVLCAEEIRRQLFEADRDAAFLIDNENGQILQANAAAVALYGYTEAELLGMRNTGLSAEPDRTAQATVQSPAGGFFAALRLHRKKDGTTFPVELSARFLVVGRRPMHVAAVRDISERTQHEDEREAMIRILRTVASDTDLQGFVRELTAVLQQSSGCQLVGVRLQDGKEALPEPAGDPVLDRMCGNVLRGRIDPHQPGFTHHGTFWTNSMSRWLSATTEADRQWRIRDRCNAGGCESVALIPLRVGKRILGLLQFHDFRPERFTPEKIAMLERAATSIAVGLDRRRTIQALNDRDEEYRTLFDSAGDAIFIGDLSGQILAVNHAACVRYGYTRSELVSMRVAEIDSPEHAACVEERIAAVMGNEGLNFEAVHRRKDGSQVSVDVNARRVTWRGEPAVMSICRDITERARSAQALRRSEQRKRAIIETAMDGFWCVDLQGRFLEVNETYCRMSGYGREELLSMGIAEVEATESPEDVAERIRQVMERREARFQSQHRRKDGTVFPVEVSAQYRPDESELVTFIRDISDRTRSEAALAERSRYIETILENAPIGFAVNTIDDGKALFIGKKFEDIYGVRHGSIAAVDDYFEQVYLDPRFREQMRARVVADMTSGDPARMRWEDIPITTAAGEHRYITAVNIPIFEQNLMVSTVQDVTERKAAEAARCESEERLRAIAESARDAIVMMDDAGCIVFWNPAAERIFGYTVAEAVGQNLHELLVPTRYLPAQRAAFPQFQNQGAGKALSATFELDARRKDGCEFPVELSVSGFLHDGRWHAVGIVRDISERKRAEEALRESEERFRAFVEQAADAIFVHDYSGRFIAVNQQASASLGYSREELLGMGVLDIEQDFDLEKAQAAWSRIGPGQMTTLRGHHRRKDGTTFPVEVRFGRFELQGERCFLGLVRDVTERERAQQELAQTNLRLNLAIASGRLGIWEWDIQSDALVWDGRMFELYGVPRAQFTGCYEVWQNGLHPEDRKRAVAAIDAAIRNERQYELEFRVVRPDGEVRHIKADALVIRDANGRAVRMVGLNQDITDRIRAERDRDKLKTQLVQAQKMESIGRLAGGVAHDFNNLLTVINGYSKMLLAELGDTDPMRESVAEIDKAGDRAAGLTRQLLAFSRKQVLDPRRLDLNRLVAEMRPMLERLVGEDVEVCAALKAKRPIILADPHQLEQVVMNLVVNARDAMPGAGRLLVETADVVRDAGWAGVHPEAPPGRYVMLGVSDTGVGMSEETKSRIFEPFFTTKGVGKGTGLGLSMVQGIVAQSGGSIEVYSEEGNGTTFKVYLPTLAHETAETGALRPRPGLGGTETILVAEDQAEVRRYAVAALRSKGYRVIPADNAEEALCQGQREHIDLLLTDVVMPRVNGKELAGRLKQVQPGIKVLFMSGYTDSVIEHHGVLEGGAQFIQKPFSSDELAGKVRAVLGNAAPAARIVVADDEPAVRAVLRKALEHGGYEVIEVANGKLALRQAVSERADLVITDLIMPEQEGIETIRALRRDLPDAGIIAISGAFEGRFLPIAQMLGAAAVLTKPVSIDSLLAKVAEVLKARRQGER